MENFKVESKFPSDACLTYFEIVNLLSEAHSLARMPLTNRFPTNKTFSCTISQS